MIGLGQTTIHLPHTILLVLGTSNPIACRFGVFQPHKTIHVKLFSCYLVPRSNFLAEVYSGSTGISKLPSVCW
jgi:hypothetical protein